jgi:hypothetical protein
MYGMYAIYCIYGIYIYIYMVYFCGILATVFGPDARSVAENTFLILSVDNKSTFLFKDLYLFIYLLFISLKNTHNVRNLDMESCPAIISFCGSSICTHTLPVFATLRLD